MLRRMPGSRIFLDSHVEDGTGSLVYDGGDAVFLAKNTDGHAIAAQSAKILAQADNGERPCAWRRKTLHSRQCLFEELRRLGAHSIAGALPDADPKSP